MIQLNSNQKILIEAASIASYPQEMCGILTNNSFYHLNNCSETPEKSFRIDPKEMYQHTSEAIAIVHSHTKSQRERSIYDLRTPSKADVAGQKATGIPWLIVGTDGDHVTDPLQIPRTPSSDYLGRPFIWYINDCYTIICDWYKFELGITLPGHGDFAQDNLHNIFDAYITDYGFRQVQLKDIQEHDIVTLNLSGMAESHIGVYTDGKILHQLGISVMSPIHDYYTNIGKVLRYAR